ncbi:hypothetical protein ACEQPO_05045 [Bacillus sp. SL00103]
MDTVQLYRFATVASLAEYLFKEQSEQAQKPASHPVKKHVPGAYGYCDCRNGWKIPGASSLEDFWRRLVNGEEMIHFSQKKSSRKQGWMRLSTSIRISLEQKVVYRDRRL